MVGTQVGVIVGCDVGAHVGTLLGCDEGTDDGKDVGIHVGKVEGCDEGTDVGELDGKDVGPYAANTHLFAFHFASCCERVEMSLVCPCALRLGYDWDTSFALATLPNAYPRDSE